MVAISPLVFLLILTVISVVVVTLILLYRDNRRLFWCVGLALAAHVAAVAGTLLVAIIALLLDAAFVVVRRFSTPKGIRV